MSTPAFLILKSLLSVWLLTLSVLMGGNAVRKIEFRSTPSYSTQPVMASIPNPASGVLWLATITSFASSLVVLASALEDYNQVQWETSIRNAAQNAGKNTHQSLPPGFSPQLEDKQNLAYFKSADFAQVFEAPETEADPWNVSQEREDLEPVSPSFGSQSSGLQQEIAAQVDDVFATKTNLDFANRKKA